MGGLSRKSRRVLPRVDGEPVAKHKTSATLHESVAFSKKRAPRCMGTLVGTTVCRQPGPTGPGDPKGNPRHRKATPRRRQKLPKAKRQTCKKRPTGKTELQETERAAKNYGKIKHQSTKHAKRKKQRSGLYWKTQVGRATPPKWRRAL